LRRIECGCGSRESAQASAEFVGISIGNELLDLMVRLFPGRKRTSEQAFPLGSELQNAAAAIGGVLRHFEQSATFKRFQSSGQRGAIHGEQRGYWAHGRRLGAIQRHEKGELSIGKVEWTQDFVEAARQGASRALHMKTEATVAD
jgi:hypothetical protein